MRRFTTLSLAAVTCLALAGCGLPDAVAYGVKAAKGTRSTQASAPAAEPAYRSPAPTPEDPDPAPLPRPVQRDSIQVEPLPPPG